MTSPWFSCEPLSTWCERESERGGQQDARMATVARIIGNPWPPPTLNTRGSATTTAMIAPCLSPRGTQSDAHQVVVHTHMRGGLHGLLKPLRVTSVLNRAFRAVCSAPTHPKATACGAEGCEGWLTRSKSEETSGVKLWDSPTRCSSDSSFLLSQQQSCVAWPSLGVVQTFEAREVLRGLALLHDLCRCRHYTTLMPSSKLTTTEGLLG